MVRPFVWPVRDAYAVVDANKVVFSIVKYNLLVQCDYSAEALPVPPTFSVTLFLCECDAIPHLQWVSGIYTE